MKKPNNNERITEYLFPVEFTKNKNNAVLETLSKEFLLNKVFIKKEMKSPVEYYIPNPSPFLGSYIGNNGFISKKKS